MQLKRKRMFTTSVQFTQDQDDNLFSIMEFENITSKAELIRKTVDFYIEQKYPQLL